MTFDTTLAAFLAGLVTGVHCAGMCGPLVCGLGCLKGGAGNPAPMVAYHGTRMLSYTGLGALAGVIGEQPLRWWFGTPAAALPWVLVGILVLVATGLASKIPLPAPAKKLTARIHLWIRGLHSLPAGAALGLATPLLPCGPLYLMFGACLFAGSALAGAEIALAFAAGTIPLLWLTGAAFGKLRPIFGAGKIALLQRGLALVAASALAWRLVAAGGTASCGCH